MMRLDARNFGLAVYSPFRFLAARMNRSAEIRTNLGRRTPSRMVLDCPCEYRTGCSAYTSYAEQASDKQRVFGREDVDALGRESRSVTIAGHGSRTRSTDRRAADIIVPAGRRHPEPA
jgi:hypothetical protein